MNNSMSVDAGLFVAQIGELDTHFGRLQADVVQAISDGRINVVERDRLRIRLQGLRTATESLLMSLSPSRFDAVACNDHEIDP